MDTEPTPRIIKDSYHASHTVEFCPSNPGSAALFLTHYSSKVHVTLTGPTYDKFYASYERASIIASITCDAGEPPAGASGKLLATIKKNIRSQNHADLATTIQNAFASVIDHTMYKRCTFAFGVHIMHAGENLLATILCGCSLALIASGVECVTTLIPQSIVVIKQDAGNDTTGEACVLVNPSKKHFAALSEKYATRAKGLHIHSTTIAHDITGESILSMVFDTCPRDIYEALELPLTAIDPQQDPKVCTQSVSVAESIAFTEIEAFAEWMKATYTAQCLKIMAECPQEKGPADEIGFVGDEDSE